MTDLAVTVTLDFSTAAGIALGDQSLDALCLPKAEIQPAMMAEMLRAAPVSSDYILITRSGFESPAYRVRK